MSDTHLQIYHTVPQTHALGPFLRFALWVQGCPFSCTGCMTPNALAFSGGQRRTVESLRTQILATADIEGITLSGGEPFAQAAGLAELVDSIKASRDLGVIVYSGYRLAALQRRAQVEHGVATLLSLIDVLIDGLYVDNLNDGLSLRGSANQQIHPLTDRYHEQIDSLYAKPQRSVEIHLQAQEMTIVGIPGSEALQQWQTRFRSRQL